MGGDMPLYGSLLSLSIWMIILPNTILLLLMDAQNVELLSYYTITDVYILH
jgi:hypothetical protein